MLGQGNGQLLAAVSKKLVVITPVALGSLSEVAQEARLFCFRWAENDLAGHANKSGRAATEEPNTMINRDGDAVFTPVLEL